MNLDISKVEIAMINANLLTLEQFSSDALIDELKRRLKTRDARHENT